MNAISWTRRLEPETISVSFPAPTEPLSINKAHTLHWAQRRRLTDPWREMGTLVGRRLKAAQAWPPLVAEGVHPISGLCGPVPVTIQVDLPFRRAARRDPHNYTGTVVKALVDGLVAGGVIPDDGPEWATILDSSFTIQRDKSRPVMARVTITQRSSNHGPDPS